jgi:hypothetical protein
MLAVILLFKHFIVDYPSPVRTHNQPAASEQSAGSSENFLWEEGMLSFHLWRGILNYYHAIEPLVCDPERVRVQRELVSIGEGDTLASYVPYLHTCYGGFFGAQAAELGAYADIVSQLEAPVMLSSLWDIPPGSYYLNIK